MRVRGGRQSAGELRKVRKEAEELGVRGASALGSFAAKADKFKAFGRKMTLYATVPLALAAGGAIQAAVDYESAFAGVRKTVSASEPQLQSLSNTLRTMSTEIPVSAGELAGLAEAAGQLGIKTKNIEGFVRTMADLGVATNMSGEDAASQLARFANITKMSQNDFDRLGSTVVALGNNMATTESEIVSMGMRIAGAGSQVGMSEAQIMSFAAGLSSVGIEAEAGGTAISTAFLKMMSASKGGGDALGEFAKIAGMSGDDFAKAFEQNAGGAMIKFMEGLQGIKKDGGDVSKALKDVGLGGIRATDVMLRTSGAGDLMRKALGLGTEAWRENTALTKEAEERYKTFESRLRIFKNKLKYIAITLGTALLPTLTVLLDKGEGMLSWLQNTDPTMQKVIIGTVIFAAALGPLAWVLGAVMSAGATYLRVMVGMKKGMDAVRNSTTLLRIQLFMLNIQQKLSAFWSNAVAGGMLKLRIQMALLWTWTKLVTAGQWLLNIALTANPIGVVIMAIAALVAAFVIAYVKITWFRNFINKYGPYIMAPLTGGLSLLIPLIIRNFSKIVSFVRALPGRISSAASGMWDGVKSAFRSAINWIIKKWNGLDFKLPSVDGGPLGRVGGFTLGTPDIPLLADGGYVRGPGSWISGEVPGEAELSTLMPNGSVKVQPLGAGSASAARASGSGEVVEHRWFIDSREITDSVGHQVRIRGANA